MNVRIYKQKAACQPSRNSLCTPQRRWHAERPAAAGERDPTASPPPFPKACATALSTNFHSRANPNIAEREQIRISATKAEGTTTQSRFQQVGLFIQLGRFVCDRSPSHVVASPTRGRSWLEVDATVFDEALCVICVRGDDKFLFSFHCYVLFGFQR
jgi:hypothetical protein